ncbi:DUF5701 family protein [Mycobacterium sp. LTG2003]
MPNTAHPVPSTAPATLPGLGEQAERLIALGLHTVGGLSASAVRAAARQPGEPAALLVVHPDLISARTLASLLTVDDKPGFVVSDMDDVDEFTAIDSVTVPDRPAYLVSGLDRGDAMANWSPDEALPAIAAAGRTPSTLTEGLFWVLQQPGILERGHCFMTIGSRKRKRDGTLDARTPALWISNGTGRDGPENRNAPKVGWCWAGNRHTWLGFASAGARTAVPAGEGNSTRVH